MINEAIVKLVDKKDLTFDEAEQVLDEIMSGTCTDVQIGSFLTALACKGATIDEITGCAKGMRNHCEKFLNDDDVLEIVGTGGDKANSFNISTASAFVCSAAGVPVAKHGNRAATSKCGTADCLEALGAKLNLPAEKSQQILKDINFCFMFAQNYHLSMKYVGPVRKQLPIATVFNILGPLTNPAGATMQLMGVYDEDLVEPLAHVLVNLGVKKCMVVYGEDCLDEISTSAPTKVCEYLGDGYKTYEITPEQFGMPRSTKDELVGGKPAENAQIIRDIFSGKEKGAKRNAVLLNSAAGLRIAKGVSMEEGLKIAAEAIDSGKALEQVDKYVKLSNED